MNILIVDDRPTNLKLLRVMLEAEGATVTEATDGVEALGVLKRVEVDAIISDILMPRMDGYRLCMEVRANAHSCNVPFIAYSATYNSPLEERRIVDLGADRVLGKLTSSAALATILGEVVQERFRRPPTPARAQPETYLIREYNERLVAKLEEKNIELEAKQERLTRTDDELSTSHAQWQRALDHCPVVIYGLKWEGDKVVLRVASENVKQLISFDAREPLSYEGWMAQIHPNDRAAALAYTFGAQEGATRIEYRLLHHDGSIHWIEDHRWIVCDPAGEPLEFTGSWTDITARKQAQSKLALHSTLTTALAEDSPASQVYQKILATIGGNFEWDFGELWMVERNAVVLRCAEVWHLPSTAFWEFALARRDLRFTLGQDLPGRIWASGRTEWCSEVEQDTVPSFPQPRPLDLPHWIGFPIKSREKVVGVVGFFRAKALPPDAELLALFDTIGLQLGLFIERQQLGEELHQAQKMSALGRLAGGIAHDFNNILCGICGYGELARSDAGANASLTANLEAMMNGARRATDLVHQILAFSCRHDQVRRPIQLLNITEEALRLLRASVPATIEFVTSLANDAPVVLAHETQIHQILMNLGTNAAHAMRDHGGRLTVKLEKCSIDVEVGTGSSKLPVGHYARITVTDTGHGMDQPTLERIFEPLFTTKPSGIGVGLGLSIVRDIVDSHKGVITVSSAKGQGTTFQVYLPEHLGPAKENAAANVLVPQGAGERILFVDDESTITELGKLVLDRLGYITETCSDGRRALDLVCTNPNAYALVITDQMMPGITGTDLAEKLSAIRPDLPIIIATGCPDTLVPDRLRALGIREVLCKPVSMQALALAAHRVLSTAAVPSSKAPVAPSLILKNAQETANFR